MNKLLNRIEAMLLAFLIMFSAVPLEAFASNQVMSLSGDTRFTGNDGVAFAKQPSKGIIFEASVMTLDDYDNIQKQELDFSKYYVYDSGLNQSIFFCHPELYNQIENNKEGRSLAWYDRNGKMQVKSFNDKSAIGRVKSYTPTDELKIIPLLRDYGDTLISEDPNSKGTMKTNYQIIKDNLPTLLTKGEQASSNLGAYFNKIATSGGEEVVIELYDPNYGDYLGEKNVTQLNRLETLLNVYVYIKNYSNENEDLIKYWDNVINSFLDGDKSIAFKLQTSCVVDFEINNEHKTMITRTIDYISYSVGLTNYYSFYAKDRLTSDASDVNAFNQKSFNQRLVELASESLATNTIASRPNDGTTVSQNNPFAWGYSAIMDKYLFVKPNVHEGSTTYSSAFHKKLQKALDGYSMFGQNLFIMEVEKTPRIKINLEAKPNFTIVKQDTINTPISLTLSSTLTQNELSQFSNYEKDSKVEINLHFTKTPSGTTQLTISPNDSIDKDKTITYSELITFLNGEEDLKFVDQSLVNEPIEINETKEFQYHVTLTIKLTDNTNKTLTIKGESVDCDNNLVKFVRKDSEVFMTYYSEPRNYAEIKEGTPENESFEAMAGVPSTETLYFSSGGSEFIVEIELQYMQDQKVTREYTSHFNANDCEFKVPDTAKNISGAPEHGGIAASDTYRTTVTNSGHSAPCTDSHPSKTYTYTDHTGTTRSITVTPQCKQVSSSTSHDYATDSEGHSYDCGPCSTTATYEHTYTIPMHSLCGPCCQHILPEVEDNWSQDITYDYIKINDCHVWKIDQANVNGMSEITYDETDEIKALIKQADPNIFYNIAETESSEDGRLRYSVEPQQHDKVYWEEKNEQGELKRSNKCDGLVSNSANVNPVTTQGHQNSWASNGCLYTNTSNQTEVDYHKNNMQSTKTGYTNRSDSQDQNSFEWKRFNLRRTTLNTATVISDMLILQTSSGDQSVMHFETSTTKQTQENFDDVNKTKEEMWDNNPETAAKWSKDEINLGSYNGEYDKPSVKYKGTGNGTKIITIFDKDPASLVSKETQAQVAQPQVYTKPESTIGGVSKSSPGENELRMDRVNKLMLYEDKIMQNPINPNRKYTTGIATTFWKSILQYPNEDTAIHSTSLKQTFNEKGYTKEAPYSDSSTKVNDIVVHDPVSVANAIVVGLDKDKTITYSELITFLNGEDS